MNAARRGQAGDPELWLFRGRYRVEARRVRRRRRRFREGRRAGARRMRRAYRVARRRAALRRRPRRRAAAFERSLEIDPKQPKIREYLTTRWTADSTGGHRLRHRHRRRVLFRVAAGARRSRRRPRVASRRCATLRLGQENLRAEHWDMAERSSRRRSSSIRSLELAHYGLGQVYMATKRYPEAVAAYTPAATLRAAGGAAQRRRDRERAAARTIRSSELEDQKRVLQRTAGHGAEPRRPDPARRHRSDRRAAARAATRQPTATPPTPAWISLALGSAYFRTDAMADAEREYRAAIEGRSEARRSPQQPRRRLHADRPLSARRRPRSRRRRKPGFRVNPQLKEDLKKASARR